MQTADTTIDPAKEYVILAHVDEDRHNCPLFRLDACGHRGGKSEMFAGDGTTTVDAATHAITCKCCFHMVVGETFQLSVCVRNTTDEPRHKSDVNDLVAKYIDECKPVRVPKFPEEKDDEDEVLFPTHQVTVPSYKGGSFSTFFCQWNSDKMGDSWNLTSVTYTPPEKKEDKKKQKPKAKAAKKEKKKKATSSSSSSSAPELPVDEFPQFVPLEEEDTYIADRHKNSDAKEAAAPYSKKAQGKKKKGSK